MCQQCDYPELLKASDLGITRNRLRVLENIGSHNFPLDTQPMQHTFAGRIENAEARDDGVCKTCLQLTKICS